MKFTTKLVALTLAGVLSAGAAAQAQDMKFFRIGTGGAGGTYFPIGGLIANAISNPPGSRPCDKGGSCGVPGLIAIAVSTNASVANMNAIHAGQLDAGLAGTTLQTFEYDGRSLMTRATDNNVPGDDTDDVTVEYVYDSLSRLVEETQQLSDGSSRLATDYRWQAEGLLTDVIYPDGRHIQRGHDAAARLVLIDDMEVGQAGTANYEYFGLSR